MQTQKQKEIEKTRKLTTYLKEKYLLEVVPYVGSEAQRNGVCDRWLTHHHWHHGLWCEMKDYDTRVRNLQEDFLERINRNAWNGVIVRFWPMTWQSGFVQFWPNPQNMNTAMTWYSPEDLLECLRLVSYVGSNIEVPKLV